MACTSQPARSSTLVSITDGVASVAEITLTDDEWTEQYRPLPAPSGSQMWEFDEIPYDKRGFHVWSWIDGDEGGTYVVSGYHIVNKYAYAVTEVPWQEGDDIEVVIESGADERARYKAEGVSW
jgi:hypothetical protein